MLLVIYVWQTLRLRASRVYMWRRESRDAHNVRAQLFKSVLSMTEGRSERNGETLDRFMFTKATLRFLHFTFLSVICTCYFVYPELWYIIRNTRLYMFFSIFVSWFPFYLILVGTLKFMFAICEGRSQNDIKWLVSQEKCVAFVRAYETNKYTVWIKYLCTTYNYYPVTRICFVV